GVVTTTPTGHRRVELAGGHGSHLLGSLARANALVVLPEEVDFVAAGDEVDLWLLDESER
ncbi:MAG: molybdopterin molybdenumtransferase MoeA, partial [Actinomycetes bacterium]